MRRPARTARGARPRGARRSRRGRSEGDGWTHATVVGARLGGAVAIALGGDARVTAAIGTGRVEVGIPARGGGREVVTAIARGAGGARSPPVATSVGVVAPTA